MGPVSGSIGIEIEFKAFCTFLVLPGCPTSPVPTPPWPIEASSTHKWRDQWTSSTYLPIILQYVGMFWPKRSPFMEMFEGAGWLDLNLLGLSTLGSKHILRRWLGPPNLPQPSAQAVGGAVGPYAVGQIKIQSSFERWPSWLMTAIASMMSHCLRSLASSPGSRRKRSPVWGFSFWLEQFHDPQYQM